ncbi:hypothetical protein FXO37_04297 [Capsicum annuum]|nr:hypothetical protein FXO37_04297 [Capsicum annuum]
MVSSLLQGDLQRKFARPEVYEFYTNGVGIGELFSTTIRKVNLNLSIVDIARILHISSGGWGHYVKVSWPPLDNLASALDICRKFSGNTTLVRHRRVFKREMSPLHQLYFDVVHKMILLRKERRTIASFLDLTLMELLDTKVQIDLPCLILKHMQRVLLKEVSGHALPYQFLLTPIFDDFDIFVQFWTSQTTKDIIGHVNHMMLPISMRSADNLMQRTSEAAAKGKELTDRVLLENRLYTKKDFITVDFSDGSKVRAILLRGTLGPKYACGFYRNGNCESYLFAIFIVQINSISQITSPAIGFPQVVWSANRSKLVKINSTLQLTSGGDLVLRGVESTLAWSTNTTGKSVVGLSLTVEGNLVLFDSKNGTVWKSFNHSNDALVPGQKLVSGMKLITKSNPPQTYFSRSIGGLNASRRLNYVVYLNGSLSLSSNSSNNWQTLVSISRASSAQYMKLESDGHLKVYEWQSGWNEVDDLLTGFNDECYNPMVCGRYGICSRDSVVVPNRALIQLPISDRSMIGSVHVALFRSGLNSSSEDCYLPSEIFSLANNEKNRTRFDSYAFIKVQEREFPGLPTAGAATPKPFFTGVILGFVIGLSILGIIIGIAIFIFWKKRKASEDEEDFVDHVSGMPTRFSYDDLKAATENFTKKLGEGRFGSVFEGCLVNGKKIAVKCLDGIGQKSHRLLIYEFMTNGSLEKWIYHGKQDLTIDWNCRRMIIQDIAKGLAYLHEECRQKILHLDNILLDEKYNTKLSDFGLALIEIRAKS